MSWIKTAGGAVGVIAAVIGVLATINTMLNQSREYNLQLQTQQVEREKEKTRQTDIAEREKTRQLEAEANRELQEAEQAKSLGEKAKAEREAAGLALQQEQMKNQGHQIEVNAADARAQREEKRSDRAVQLLQQKETMKEVSDLITKALSADGPSEGSLAQLSRFLSSGPENVQPIQVALEAKLAQAKTAAEVRLIFKLLRQLGTPSVEFVADANRTARAEFDRLWTLDFKRRVGMQVGERFDPEQPLFVILRNVLRDAARDYKIHGEYLSATALQQRKLEEVLGIHYGASPEEKEVVFAALKDKDRIKALWEESSRITIESQILLESRMALQYLLSRPTSDAGRDVDLSSCYLGEVRWRNITYQEVRFDQAYVGGGNFKNTSYDRNTMTRFLHTAVGVQTTPYFYDARFVPAVDDKSVVLPD